MNKKVVQQRAEKTNKLVIANFQVRDTDRLISFHEAAKEVDRTLVMNLKQAYLLDLFKKSGVVAPRLDDDNIRIYVPRKDWGVFRDNRFSTKIQFEDYDKWGGNTSNMQMQSLHKIFERAKNRTFSVVISLNLKS
jgi:mRNA degradation ribonuclease J1/J2